MGTLSDTEVTLDAAGTCTFTYTPTNGDVPQHTIEVEYVPSDIHEPSIGSFVQDVVKRKVDMAIEVDPTTAYIYQPVTVTVKLWDDTTEGAPSIPTGTVTFDEFLKVDLRVARIVAAEDVPEAKKLLKRWTE